MCPHCIIVSFSFIYLFFACLRLGLLLSLNVLNIKLSSCPFIVFVTEQVYQIQKCSKRHAELQAWLPCKLFTLTHTLHPLKHCKYTLPHVLFYISPQLKTRPQRRNWQVSVRKYCTCWLFAWIVQLYDMKCLCALVICYCLFY